MQHWATVAWAAWQPASWTPWPHSTCLLGATASATAMACLGRCVHPQGGLAPCSPCLFSRRATFSSPLPQRTCTRAPMHFEYAFVRTGLLSLLLTGCQYLVRMEIKPCWCLLLCLQTLMNGFQHEQPDYWLTFGRLAVER